MLDDVSAFSLILAFLGIIGIIAVAVGFYGTFLVLTGGDDVPNPQVEVLGTAACEDEPRLDNLDQPYVGQPDLPYQPPAALFTDVNITTTAGKTTLNASADGRIINAGAVRADRVNIPVMVNETDRRLSVQTATQPIRVWIEATSNSDAFATELRVCPGS